MPHVGVSLFKPSARPYAPMPARARCSPCIRRHGLPTHQYLVGWNAGTMKQAKPAAAQPTVRASVARVKCTTAGQAASES